MQQVFADPRQHLGANRANGASIPAGTSRPVEHHTFAGIGVPCQRVQQRG